MDLLYLTLPSIYLSSSTFVFSLTNIIVVFELKSMLLIMSALGHSSRTFSYTRERIQCYKLIANRKTKKQNTSIASLKQVLYSTPNLLLFLTSNVCWRYLYHIIRSRTWIRKLGQLWKTYHMTSW